MPQGIFVRTKKHNESMSKSKMGHTVTKKTREKLRKAFTGRYVSMETRIKMSLAHKKDKHYNWKGGISSYMKELRNSFEYRNWKRKVLKRDSYICQNKNCKYCSNKVGKGISAHHIVPVKECLLLGCIKLIYDTSNGIALCKESHVRKHFHKSD